MRLGSSLLRGLGRRQRIVEDFELKRSRGCLPRAGAIELPPRILVVELHDHRRDVEQARDQLIVQALDR